MTGKGVENLVIRPARPEDKPAVVALASQIWEGHDYLPRVWDDWLVDEYGELTVGLLDGRLVCVAKLSRLRPGYWWLEGMRVDPAFRQRGIAKAVFHHHLDLAERIVEGALGLGTTSKNTPVHRMLEPMDFERVAVFKKYTAAPLPAPSRSPFRLATPADRAQLLDWLAGSPGFQAARGLAEDRWSWYPLRPALDEVLATGRLFIWTPAGKPMAGLVLLARDDEEGFYFGLVDTLPGQMETLLRDVRAWPAVGERVMSYKTPLTEEYVAALEAAGWETDWDFSLWIYQKRMGECRVNAR